MRVMERPTLQRLTGEIEKRRKMKDDRRNRSITGAMRVHFRRRAPYVCGRYDNLIPRDAYSAVFRASGRILSAIVC
jgi:hypothetical protein